MAKEFLCEAASPRKCSIEGCEKQFLAKGLCVAHYSRLRRHGNPNGGGTPWGAPMAWVDAHIGFKGDECLAWPFARYPSGYGQISVNGRMVNAHRYILAMISPPPTPKHEAAHSCGRGSQGCCNPRHLSWKTRTENEADKVGHGTINRGERSGSAKLTESAVIAIVARATSGEMHKDIAADYGVIRQTISLIVAGKRWSYLTKAAVK